MQHQLAENVEVVLSVACEAYRKNGVVDDQDSFDQWIDSVRGRIALLRDNKVNLSQAAPLSVALRQARARRLETSTELHDIERINQNEVANTALLAYYVAQQRESLVAEAAEALEIESRTHLTNFYVNALSQYHSLSEELCEQQENSNIILNDWQKSLMEDWRLVLLRHCGAYSSLGNREVLGEAHGEAEPPSSPALPPPNPNFTIWSSSPDQLSPLSNRSGSMSSPMEPSRQHSPLPPPSTHIQPPQTAVPTEGKRRRLTLNLDVARIHYDVDQYDKVMGGAVAGVGGNRLPTFGGSEVLPSFRPQMPPAVAVASSNSSSSNNSNILTASSAGYLQVPGGDAASRMAAGMSRQRSPQEAEQPAPYRGFNFGLPPAPGGVSSHPAAAAPPAAAAATTTVGLTTLTGGGASTVSAFNPQQADLSSQLTFRAPPAGGPSQAWSSKAEEVSSRVKGPSLRAAQKKKRLSLTAKAAKAQERSDLPQWWD